MAKRTTRGSEGIDATKVVLGALRTAKHAGEWTEKEKLAVLEKARKSFVDDGRGPGAPEPDVDAARDEAAAADQDPEPEKAQKFYAGDSYMAYNGAASWAEYDAYIDAQEKHEHAQRTTTQLRYMIDNVLTRSEITDKSAALIALAEGLADRIEEGPDEKSLDELLDLYAKEVEGCDDCPTGESLMDKALAAIGKARVTKRHGGCNKPAGSFLVSEDASKPTTWHLPFKDCAGNPSRRLAGAAWAALFDPSGFRGRRYQGPGKEAARKKLRSLYSRQGWTTPGTKAVGAMDFDQPTGFIVRKDASGRWRWFGWTSNNFEDREGEILTEKGHRNFVEWVWEKPDLRMPELWLWHTPGTATKEGYDWIEYLDGFLVGSGVLDEKEAEMFRRLGSLYELGQSHTFLKAAVDPANPRHITEYYSVEGTVVPVAHAANWWTDFEQLQEAKTMGKFNPERRKFLVDAFGEEKVAELETATSKKADELTAAGVASKGAGGDEAASKTPAQPEAAKAPEGSTDAKDALDAIVKAIAGEIGLPELSKYLEGLQAKAGKVDDLEAKIAGLEKVILTLAKSDDAKVAEALTPKGGVGVDLVWKHRASKSDENVIGDGDEEPGSAPAGGDGTWVSEALNASRRESAPIPR